MIAGAGGLLFLAGITAQAGWLFVLAAGVIGLILGSLTVRQHLGDAEVVRSLPRRTRVGDDLRVGLTLTNAGRRKLPMVRVTDRFAAFDPVNAVSGERLAPGESARIEQVRRSSQRGVFDSGPCVLRAGAPFGFMTTSRTLEVPSPLVVVPRWVELASFPILEPSSIPSDVLHERARTGAGEEYMGVRDYRPGDPRRAVHWRSTARAGHLVVREFEEEVASKVALVVAGPDAGEPPDSAFEALVAAAASIAIYALQTGHPVELFRPAPDGEVARIGGPDRYALLDWLAEAEPLDAPLGPMLAETIARIGRRGTVVICAPTKGRAAEDLPVAVRMVQSAGSRPIVIAARSSSWSLAPDPNEEHLMSELRSGRGPVRAIARGDDLTRCLTSLATT